MKSIATISSILLVANLGLASKLLKTDEQNLVGTYVVRLDDMSEAVIVAEEGGTFVQQEVILASGKKTDCAGFYKLDQGRLTTDSLCNDGSKRQYIFDISKSSAESIQRGVLLKSKITINGKNNLAQAKLQKIK